MANPEHLKILEQGVEVWNKWRKNNPLVVPDFSDQDFSGRNLSGANFTGADFMNANLSGGNLVEANFAGTNFLIANLQEANLVETNLTGADFGLVTLTRANLTRANLQRTELTESQLCDADLNQAILRGTIFSDCNLTGAKNLESCKHESWSIIDHRTLIQSGSLPISFLRGCGLPDEIIDLIPVLQNDPIIFYSCFISYSSKDEEFANRLYADLQDKGIRCWYAPEKMKGGKKIYDQVNEAIRMHDKLLLVLSEDSMRSDWVATEIKKARAREKQEKRQMLFPIGIVPYDYIKQWELFDADTGSDLAAEVRSYHIPDFSEWKRHDSYKKGFERVVRDLKGEKLSPA